MSTRVTFLSTTESQGGAAKAVNRLHHEINSIKDISSSMIVKTKSSTDPNVRIDYGSKKSVLRSFLSPYLDRLIAKFVGANKRGLMSCGLFGSRGCSKFEISTDVICLTWVMGGYLSVKDISQILSLGLPIVWRLSDLWPLTGGCHYSYDCSGFKNSCNNCPEINKKMFNFLSSYVLAMKIKSWSTQNLILVAPSFWMKKMVESSTLFSEVDCRVIHTGVDLKVFKTIDMHDARKTLGIKTSNRLILFGAADAVGDERKGLRYLIEALKLMLEKQNDFSLVIFGTRNIPEGLEGVESFPLGIIHDDTLLATAYCACDVFVAPSIEENLANTVIESLACGTPVVAFDVGGMPDMVDHGKNGYLAHARDSFDLMNGISWVLDSGANSLRKHARKKAELNFDSAKTAQQYVDLFKEVSS